MEMKEVISSNIMAIGFEEQAPKLIEGSEDKKPIRMGLLQVQFQGGGMYRYFDVPVSVYEALMQADSKGKFMNANVARKFKYERFTVEKQVDTEAPKHG